MHFALQGLRTDPVEENVPVPGVAVQFCGGAVTGFEPIFKRQESDVIKPHRIIKVLFHIGIQPLAGDRFDHKTEKDIVHVGIEGPCPRLIKQRRFADGFQRLLP